MEAPEPEKMNTDMNSLYSQGMVVPYRWGSDTNSLFLRLRRPTPCAPIRTNVFLLKGGTLATSSYIRSSWRSNSRQKPEI